MDYPCAKFGDFSFSRFGVTVRTDGQTETQHRIRDADDCCTNATIPPASVWPNYPVSIYSS